MVASRGGLAYVLGKPAQRFIDIFVPLALVAAFRKGLTTYAGRGQMKPAMKHTLEALARAEQDARRALERAVAQLEAAKQSVETATSAWTKANREFNEEKARQELRKHK
jgi:hypothetical protein